MSWINGSIRLTFKCTSENPPVGAQGGLGTYSLPKTLFPVEYLHTNYTIDRDHQTLLISEKKNIKKSFRFKMAAVWNF